MEYVDYASFGAESEYRQSYGLQENVREYIPSTCRIASKCKCFTTEELGLVTAAQLHLTSYKSVLDFAENIRPKCREKIASQLLLDCLTMNTDRHFGNIGFLYHNDSFDIVDVIQHLGKLPSVEYSGRSICNFSWIELVLSKNQEISKLWSFE